MATMSVPKSSRFYNEIIIVVKDLKSFRTRWIIEYMNYRKKKERKKTKLKTSGSQSDTTGLTRV